MENNNMDFINLTEENIDYEHLCCIIRSRVSHQGVESKRSWLKDRLSEGHVFRKLDAKTTVFIEYAPLEKAWVPIVGYNYLYIYCLWVTGEYKGKGYGKALLEYCIEDAHKKGKSGICMLGAKKQKAWLTDQSFAKKHGFEVVDSTDDGYELLALSFDNTKPHFSDSVKKHKTDDDTLTVFYDMQCPFILSYVESIKCFCTDNNIPLHLKQITTLEEAKNLPCVFNNFAVFYKGKLQTVNLIDTNTLSSIILK